MSKIMILQPGYLPWLGFFDMMNKSDTLIIHDDLQYDKGSWRNRNRIRTKEAWCWLTVPVYLKGHSKEKILDIKIDNTKQWKSRQQNLIRASYNKAPFFDKYFDPLKDILNKDWDFLVDLDIELINWIVKELGIQKKILYSHDLKLDGTRSTMRLISICKQLDSDTYLSGSRGRNYIQEDIFKKEGVKLEYHDYDHPIYIQQFDGFIPYMSIIDLLFNIGPDSLKILSR
ncbi:WbqC family protein [bacterium]|nr:WbqC family protein [bacterium]